MRFLWYIVTALLVLATSGAFGATYYIDDEGTDDSDCESAIACGATACASWHGLEDRVVLTSGDIINLCPTEDATYDFADTNGNHCGIQITENGITVQGSSGNRTDVIVGGGGSGNALCGEGSVEDLATFNIQNVSTITIKNLSMTTTFEGENSGYCRGVYVRTSDNITLDNVRIFNTQGPPVYAGTVGPGGGSAATKLRIEDSLLEDGFQSSVVGGQSGITCFKCPLLEVIHTQVLDNYDGTQSDIDGIHLANSHGFLLQDVEVRGAGEEGIDISRTGSNDLPKAGVAGCPSWNGGGCISGSEEGSACHVDSDCAGGGTCQPWIIERTVSYGNGQETGAGGGAIKLTTCAHTGIVRNNFLVGDGTPSEAGRAIRLEECAHDVKFYNNTLLGGFLLWNNNYALDFENNITICDTDSDSCMFICDQCWNLNAGQETTETNNLIVNRGTNYATHRDNGAAWEGNDQDNCDNLGCCDIQPTDSSTTGFSDDSSGLSTWQATTYWLGGPGTSDIWGQDVNVENEISTPPDLHLASSDNSGARNGGTTIVGFSTDYDNQSRPNGAAWDIGADEYLACHGG